MKTQFYTIFLFSAIVTMSCSSPLSSSGNKNRVAKIDLTHWEITIPTPREDGKAKEVSPPEIFDYANIEALKEFMYNDSTYGSIVFHQSSDKGAFGKFKISDLEVSH